MCVEVNTSRERLQQELRDEMPQVGVFNSFKTGVVLSRAHYAFQRDELSSLVMLLQLKSPPGKEMMIMETALHRCRGNERKTYKSQFMGVLHYTLLATKALVQPNPIVTLPHSKHSMTHVTSVGLSSKRRLLFLRSFDDGVLFHWADDHVCQWAYSNDEVPCELCANNPHVVSFSRMRHLEP